jgi:hypothetical protein
VKGWKQVEEEEMAIKWCRCVEAETSGKLLRGAAVVDVNNGGESGRRRRRQQEGPGCRQKAGTSCSYWNTWLVVVENMREEMCLRGTGR